jgi:hypothetical protein
MPPVALDRNHVYETEKRVFTEKDGGIRPFPATGFRSTGHGR